MATSIVTGLELGSPEWVAAMDALVRKETGWDSLDEMCRNSPTLRPYDGSLKQLAICVQLREAFRFVTGREAYGDDPRNPVERRYLRTREVV